MIRLFVVHQSQLVASLIASLLSDEEDLLVVGQVNSTADAIRRLPRSEVDILLLDATLPENGALELTREVNEAFPSIKVLVFGLPESKSLIVQYVMAGAAGYVLHEVPAHKLLQNIRAAHEDKALISPEIAALFMEQIADLAQMSSRVNLRPSAYDELTPRELEVLTLIDKGLTNREIGKRLFIEVGTVKNHVHNILDKLDVSSREDAAAHLPYIEDHRE